MNYALNMLMILAKAEPVTTTVYNYDPYLTPYILEMTDGTTANTPPFENEFIITQIKYIGAT